MSGTQTRGIVVVVISGKRFCGGIAEQDPGRRTGNRFEILGSIASGGIHGIIIDPIVPAAGNFIPAAERITGRCRSQTAGFRTPQNPKENLSVM